MSKENEKMLDASIGMAIVDALPVLCFSASMLLIRPDGRRMHCDDSDPGG